MIIKPKNSEIHQLWLRATDHFILTLTTFLLSVLLILYLGMKSGSGAVDYLFANDYNFPLICLGITIIANLVLFFQNWKNSSVRELEFNENKGLYIIRYRKGYSNINRFTTEFSENISFEKKTIKNVLGGSTKTINIIIKGKVAFTFNLDDVIWSTDKEAVYELYELVG